MENQLWKVLLNLKTQIKEYQGDLSFCHIQTDGSIGLNEILESKPSVEDVLLFFEDEAISNLTEATSFQFINKSHLNLIKKGNLPTSALKFLSTYLPYALFSVFAKLEKRAITAAHFAQSLDGRIATLSGHSKWIGNEENLLHAHRMRALSDAVLIGTGTLLSDQPKLTVRHVEGPNPIRVILGRPGKCSDYNCLYESCQQGILAIGADKSELNGQIDYIQMISDQGRINSVKVLELLYQRGYHSVYLEGGAITTSNFLKDKAIDVLQLHFSPIIFGSGKSSIVLPEIEAVDNAVQFSSFQFQQIGDTMMFVGELS